MNTRKFSCGFSGLLIAGSLAASCAFAQTSAVSASPAVKATVEQKAVDVKAKEAATVTMTKDAKKEVTAVKPAVATTDATVKAVAKTHVTAKHSAKAEKTAATMKASTGDGKQIAQTKTASKLEVKSAEKPIAKPVS